MKRREREKQKNYQTGSQLHARQLHEHSFVTSLSSNRKKNNKNKMHYKINTWMEVEHLSFSSLPKNFISIFSSSHSLSLCPMCLQKTLSDFQSVTDFSIFLTFLSFFPPIFVLTSKVVTRVCSQYIFLGKMCSMLSRLSCLTFNNSL